MNKKVLMSLMTLTALTCFLVVHQRGEIMKPSEVKSALDELAAAEPPASISARQSPVAAAGPSGESNINRTYLHLHFADPQRPVDGASILEIGKCLRSGNREFHDSCESMGVYTT